MPRSSFLHSLITAKEKLYLKFDLQSFRINAESVTIFLFKLTELLR